MIYFELTSFLIGCIAGLGLATFTNWFAGRMSVNKVYPELDKYAEKELRRNYTIPKNHFYCIFCKRLTEQKQLPDPDLWECLQCGEISTN